MWLVCLQGTKWGAMGRWGTMLMPQWTVGDWRVEVGVLSAPDRVSGAGREGFIGRTEHLASRTEKKEQSCRPVAMSVPQGLGGFYFMLASKVLLLARPVYM